jgi:hypothetical protein
MRFNLSVRGTADGTIKLFKPESIKLVKKFHKSIIDSRDNLGNASYGGVMSMSLDLGSYEFNSTWKYRREFLQDNDSFKALLESGEFRKWNSAIREDIETVNLRNFNHGMFAIEPAQWKELTAAVSQDLQSLSFEQLTADDADNAAILLAYKNKDGASISISLDFAKPSSG